MSRLQDIFTEDIDDGHDLERIVEGENNSDGGNSEDDENDKNSHSEAEEEAPKKRVDPTIKKSVRGPSNVLNPRRLTGPRGIQTIQEFFKDFKFLGKDKEKEDLDMVMKKLEHWAHRLYPKYQFDDCLEKIAWLGNKREINVHIRKIRLGMITDSQDDIVRQSDSEGECEEVAPQAPAMDEFDTLLEQQIALARSTPRNITHNHSTISDDNTPFRSHVYVNNSTTSTPARIDHGPATSTPQLSEEQKARMMKNRMLAEERRLARMKQNAVTGNSQQQVGHNKGETVQKNPSVDCHGSYNSVNNPSQDDRDRENIANVEKCIENVPTDVEMVEVFDH